MKVKTESYFFPKCKLHVKNISVFSSPAVVGHSTTYPKFGRQFLEFWKIFVSTA